MERKNALSNLLSFLLFIPVSFIVVVLIFIRMFIALALGVEDILLSENLYRIGSEFGVLLALVLSMVGIYIFSVILHELGHFLFGLVTGRRFKYIGFFGFAVIRGTDGRLKFRRLKIRGAMGFCCMLPRNNEEKTIPLAFYLLGGCFMNFLLFCLFSLAFLFYFGNFLLIFSLLLGAIFNIVVFLRNILPFYSSFVESDGRQLYTFLHYPESTKAFAKNELIDELIFDGKTLREMPNELFEPICISDIVTRTQAVFMGNCASRLLEEGRVEEAKKLMDDLLLYQLDLPVAVHVCLSCERIVLELLSSFPDRERVAQLYDKTLKKRMKTMAISTTVQCATYILSLLYERDTFTEGKSCYYFEYYAKKSLYPAGVELERKMMNEAKRRSLNSEKAEN